MKIFYTITKSETGGAQTYVFQLANYFKSLQNEIFLMAYPGGWLEREIKKIGGSFYPNKYFKNNLDPVSGFWAVREIKRVVKEIKPDLIHCNSTVAGFWTSLAIKNKIPTIFTVHGWGFTPGTPLWRKIIILAEKIASRYYQKIICVSEFDRNLALKYKIAPPEKLITIHNGIEIFGENLKTLNSKIKIAFVGRLIKQKNPEFLVEAFFELPKNIKQGAEVLVVGDGPKRKKLERMIDELSLREKVKLFGEAPREKVIEILKNSDIFVLTSNYEGFPITILEAMSCGLPVIVSNVGGVKEAVDEEVGYLIERRDKETFKRALIELIENPKIREEKGQKARERIEKYFSLEKMLKETERVYNELIKQRGL